MSPCPCSPATLTAVRLGERVVLLRCSAHEYQVWQVDGAPADRAQALGALRTVFVDERGRRRVTAGAPRAAAPRAAAPRAARVEPRAATVPDAPAAPPDDAALTAVLRARGLPGTWAVA